MIAKTSIGRSFKGCCAYNLEKVEKGKGQVLFSQGVRDYDQDAMVADFTRQAKLNPALSRSVWHTAVSFSPQDEARLVADPQLMNQVATAYLTGMGLAQSQYVVVRHTDTDHSHFHLIANRVASNGRTVSDSHNFSRSEKLLRQIEQEYGLTPMIEQAQRQGLERVPDLDRQRIELRDKVRACLSRSTSGATFQAELSRYGIRLLVNRDTTGQARGITFEQTRMSADGRSETVVAFKGSKLHQHLSSGQIERQLQQQRAQRVQKAAQEPRFNEDRHDIGDEEKAPEIKQKRGPSRRL